MGTAGPSQQVQTTFKVKDKGSYSVQGALSSGVIVFTGGAKTVTEDLPHEQVTISKLDAAIVDPNDITQILSDFGQLGPNIGFNPVTVQSALSSLFGGLVYYVDAQSQGADQQPVIIEPASQLTGPTDYATFPWPSGHATNDATVSTSASVQAGASVPVWGSLSTSFSANSMYKTHWSMQQVGNVLKNDTTSFVVKLEALPQADKDNICNMLQQPDSHVMYVNSMYVIRSVVLTFQQGKEIKAGGSLSGGSIITANAAYDFSSSGTQEAEADERVVNVAGPTYTKSTLPICGAPHKTLGVIEKVSLKGSIKDMEHPPVTLKSVPKP